MLEKTSTASESSLGMMEGLRSYTPNQGWEELSPEKKEDSVLVEGSSKEKEGVS